MGFSAALLSLGYVIGPELEIGEGAAQRVFCFDMEQGRMDELLTQYRQMDLPVDAYKNAQSLKKVKRMLREQSA